MSVSAQAGRVLLPGFVGTALPEWLEARLRDGLGGVCLFGPNIVSPDQLRALTDSIYAANPLAIVAIDEEGGDVTRLYYASGAPFPGNAVLGRIDDTDATRNVAGSVGWELRRAGVNVDFAPDVDVNSNPDNPVIGVRSFGADVSLVATHAAAWTQGLQSTGVAASAKHFPGHGDTALDSHLSLPVIDRSLDELRARELVPFRAAIEAGTRTIMSSHIMLPQVDAESPATFSRTILQGVLRDELGFGGVIVTDALDMKGASGEHGIPEAAVRALIGGCDLLCLGTENTDAQLGEIQSAIAAAVTEGRLGSSRIADAASRVIALADDLRAQRAEIAVPASETRGGAAGSGADSFALPRSAAVIAAFDLQPVARQWPGYGRDVSVVRVETAANIAIGVAPWGPFAAAADPDRSAAAAAFAAHPVTVISRDAAQLADLPQNRPVILIGKANHRHDFARAAIDELRATRDDVLVVDMGWPSDDRRYADIATFGASRLVGDALARVLGGADLPTAPDEPTGADAPTVNDLPTGADA